jgi:hypothetical protein
MPATADALYTSMDASATGHYVVTVSAMFEAVDETVSHSGVAIADALMCIAEVATIWVEDPPRVSVCRMDAWGPNAETAAAQALDGMRLAVEQLHAVIRAVSVMTIESR